MKAVAGLDIRPAVLEDAEAISRLIQGVAAAFLLDPSGQGAERFMSSLSAEAIRRFVSAPNFLYFKACIGEELAGVVAVRDNNHLYHLFVASHFQGRGLARGLWKFAREQARSAGNPGFFTVNATPVAVPVYEKFGFSIQGSRVETMGIAYVPMRLECSGQR